MWGGDPTSLVPVHDEIVLVHKNHADAGATPIPKNHIDVGIVHTLENHIDAETVLILESCVEVGTIHVHASTLIGVWIPQRSDGPTTPLWM